MVFLLFWSTCFVLLTTVWQIYFWVFFSIHKKKIFTIETSGSLLGKFKVAVYCPGVRVFQGIENVILELLLLHTCGDLLLLLVKGQIVHEHDS